MILLAEAFRSGSEPALGQAEGGTSGVVEHLNHEPLNIFGTSFGQVREAAASRWSNEDGTSQTNLKEALERKFAAWAGELKDKQARIEHIKGLFQELPVLSKRAERVKVLLGCAEELRKEIDPAWKRDKVKPRRVNECQGPLPQGEVARSALAVLRQPQAEMTCRQVAITVLGRYDITEHDKGVLQRLTKNVQSNMRANDGVLVSANDDWPAKWRINVKR